MVIVKKILVVDDEPDTVVLVGSILRKAGYTIVTASSGSECLDVLKKEKPDLILLDIMMPDMSGYEVYGAIRKGDKMLKVAYLSVVDVSEERKQAMIREGLSDYITKPFTGDELVKKVNAILPSR